MATIEKILNSFKESRKMKHALKINLEDIKQAAERLKDIIEKTELIESEVFSKEAGNKVYLKPENLQVTGSYKIRGAFNKISLLSEDEKRRGIIAASAGNHAQGVAYAAKKLGISATIVMPKTTPLTKVTSTRELGANVILKGDYYDDAFIEAMKLKKENGYVFIHPFDDWEVIAGQGTIALEILNEIKDVDVILVPIGGGGLISGIAIVAKAINPKIKVIGVEASGADSMYQSVLNKKIIELNKIRTIADGVAVKKPGEITFKIVSNLVDEIIRVSDTEIMEAFLMLLEKHKLMCEPAGAVSLAALLNGKIKEQGKKIVAVISGGNIDVVTISALINRGLIKGGRVFEFSVDIPDKPGELLKISKILVEENANIIKLEHDQFKSIERFMDVKLIVTVETDGKEHISRIVEALKRGGYKFIKEDLE